MHHLNRSHRINRLTREKIINSDEFKRMKSFTYGDVVDGISGLDSIGGVIRGVPHRFICLIQKMELISVKESVIVSTLEELIPEEIDDTTSAKRFKGNVYLIAAFLLYLRLSKDAIRYESLMEFFLLDFRMVPLIDEYNSRTFIYLDVFVDDLLNATRVLDIHLSRFDRTFNQN